MDDHPTRAADDYPELAITCPRCGNDATAPFYGPCKKCKSELRSTMAVESNGTFEKEEFTPQMNVVPNQIATKE